MYDLMMTAKAPARREGFRGQHLCVLPAPLAVRARRHPLLKGLCVTDAGYFPAAAHHLIERPHGVTTTIVILCLAGEGWVRSGGGEAVVRAGHLLWLPANAPHAYGAAGRAPWTIVWAHFAGSEVEAWAELLHVAPTSRATLIPLTKDRLNEIVLDQVHVALARGHAPRHLVAAAAALRVALSAVTRLTHGPDGDSSAYERVRASIGRIRRDWLRPYRLSELALSAQLSVAHYSALFRRETGFAPIDYLIRLRMQHASQLLDTTTLSVAAVAERAGYHDAYYFSRCFRRVMAMTPRHYRKMPKG